MRHGHVALRCVALRCGIPYERAFTLGSYSMLIVVDCTPTMSSNQHVVVIRDGVADLAG